MLTVDEALARILARLAPLPAETVPAEAAYGLTLSAAVVAPRAVPGFDNSAVDGYAVHSRDLAGAWPEDPAVLTVVGSAPVGSPPVVEVGAGQAVRVMTGAPLPRGADAVVRLEDTDNGREQVRVFFATAAGTAVRRAGEDLAPGQMLLEAGSPVTAGSVAALAAAGVEAVTCHRRPRVRLVTTGDELIAPGREPGPGQVVDASRPGLLLELTAAGAVVEVLERVPDRRDSLRAALAEGEADLVVSAGAVSMGDHDHVRHLLEEEGQVDFWQVAMRPGRPLLFGTFAGRPLLGLPGNPVSSMVGALLFARPAVHRLLGRRSEPLRTLVGVAGEDIPGVAGLRHFPRCHASWEGGRWSARLAGGQGSGMLHALARANCLAVVPEGQPQVAAGEAIELVPLLPARGLIDTL
ncbi:MAG: molybdopterin molybdotransferase MoeA [Candidatus Dormibacteria bacterium]